MAAGGVRSLRIYRPRYAVPPRLGPMLDLLIRDAEHPRALAFQWHAIARDLAALAACCGPSAARAARRADPSLSDAQLMALEGSGPRRARGAPGTRAAPAVAVRGGRAALGPLVDALFLAHAASIRRRSPPEARSMRYRIRHETLIGTAPTSCTRTSCCIWCRDPRPISSASNTRSSRDARLARAPRRGRRVRQSRHAHRTGPSAPAARGDR